MSNLKFKSCYDSNSGKLQWIQCIVVSHNCHHGSPRKNFPFLNLVPSELSSIVTFFSSWQINSILSFADMIVSRFFLCLRQYITQLDKLGIVNLISFCLQMFLLNLLEMREVFDYKFMHKNQTSQFVYLLMWCLTDQELGKDYDVQLIAISDQTININSLVNSSITN